MQFDNYGDIHVLEVREVPRPVPAAGEVLVRVRAAGISPGEHEWLRDHGVTPVAYGDGVADRIRAVAPEGIDAFVDTFGNGYVDLALDLGVARDRINTIIDFAGAARTGVKSEGMDGSANAAVLAELVTLAADGDLEVPIAARYPLTEVRGAYRELMRRHTRGKIVLEP